MFSGGIILTIEMVSSSKLFDSKHLKKKKKGRNSDFKK